MSSQYHESENATYCEILPRFGCSIVCLGSPTPLPTITQVRQLAITIPCDMRRELLPIIGSVFLILRLVRTTQLMVRTGWANQMMTKERLFRPDRTRGMN